MSNPYSKYKQTDLNTASKEKILLMLYEGAIKFAKLAIKAIENKDLAQKGLMLGKAMDIVFELKNTLNEKVAPELASNLDKLYNYIIEELTQANISNDVNLISNVLNVLETLYSAWQEAVSTYQKNKLATGG